MKCKKRTEGQEHVCDHCGTRWDLDDKEPPPCKTNRYHFLHKHLDLVEILREIGIPFPSNRERTELKNFMERNNLTEYGRPDSVKHAGQISWLMPPRMGVGG